MRRAHYLSLLTSILLLSAACSSAEPEASSTPEPPPTAAPVAVVTVVPTALPPTATVPPATLTPIPQPPTAVPTVATVLFVTGTGADGLTIRNEPGGERVALAPEGSALTPTGEQERVDGRLWRHVKDTQGREGWVAAEFLSPSQPVAAQPGTSVAASTPLVTPVVALPSITAAVLLPTPTPRPPGAPAVAPTPIPTLVARADGTPTRPPAVAPQVKPSIFNTTERNAATQRSAADKDCSDFPSQAAAQAALRANPADPWRLDSDRNGIACESLPGPKDTARVRR